MANSKNGNTAAKVYELAKPLAEELGLMLWDVVFEKEGASWYLRVFIDRDGGVDIDDCEAFSRPFNKILDEKDMIAQSYIFEVGSPGIARELKRPEHFERFTGQKIRIRLIRAIDGIKEFSGILSAYTKDSVTIESNGGECEFLLSDAASVKLADDEDLF